MRKLWGATVVAVCLVVSGCVPGGGGSGESTTTSSASAEAAGNPWELPLEQRPPLFDPCAEIPVEAVERGVGSPVVPFEDLTNHQPGSLMSCGWENEEVAMSVLSTWRSKQDFLSDERFAMQGGEATFEGRKVLRSRDRGDDSQGSCHLHLFTKAGALMLTFKLFTALNEFRGEKFVDACDGLDEFARPIMGLLPEGDF